MALCFAQKTAKKTTQNKWWSAFCLDSQHICSPEVDRNGNTLTKNLRVKAHTDKQQPIVSLVPASLPVVSYLLPNQEKQLEIIGYMDCFQQLTSVRAVSPDENDPDIQQSNSHSLMP